MRSSFTQLLALGIVLGPIGCSSADTGDLPPAGTGATSATSTGGSSSPGTGGNTTATSGGSTSSGKGGSVSSGGATTIGGSTAEGKGGATTGGRTNGSGGTSTGGKASTGGSATGGTSTGGKATTGGSATGGNSTGGKAQTGGAATGGASTGGKATGGTATGGKAATGGSTAAGGVSTSNCTEAQRTLTSNSTGQHCGYTYEYWKDSGSGSLVLKADGFSVDWSNINNLLGRKGIRPGSANLVVNYEADYQPNGNSYLCVYGWTRNPLIEYYIVDSWGSWRPPGGASLGTVTSDGGTYDIYKTERVNQPSIDGTRTFFQYWSVRQSKRTSGTITVGNHFTAWAGKGMNMGAFYEVSMTVEGYQSSGKADVKMSIK